MRYFTVLVSMMIVMDSIHAKNIVDLKERFGKREGNANANADAAPKKIAHKQDLKISDEELNNMWNPFEKRSVQGTPDEINERQRLFELGKLDTDVHEETQQDGEFHILAEPQQDTMTLDDIITTNNEIGIFSKYCRDFADINAAFQNPHKKTIVLTPLNDAIMDLPLKPWEFPYPISEETNDDSLLMQNIEIFLHSHIVDSSVDLGTLLSSSGESSIITLKTISGTVLTLRNNKNDNNTLQLKIQGYDDLVVNVVDYKIVDNGAMLIIDHTLLWPDM